MPSLEFFESLASGGDGSSQLVVQHTHAHSGWATLPPALSSRLFQSGPALPLVLELRLVQQRAGVSLPSGKPVYAAWAGDGSASPGCIGLPAGLARALGLAEGATVALRPLPQAPEAVSVTVEPASEDDWEIVELNAEYLEDQLLNQAGVASPLQPLPVWVRSLGVLLRVTSMVPAGPVARLVRGTEIYVAPRLRVKPSVGEAVAAGGVLLPGQAQQSNGDGGSAGNGNMTGRQQGAAAAGQQKQQRHDDGEGADAAGAPLQAVLRVQRVSSRVASSLQSPPTASQEPLPANGKQQQQQQQAQQQQTQQQQQQQPHQQQQLPPGVQPVFACPATLARCGLCPGYWVRLSGRDTRSLTKFASLTASDLAAPGHLALTAQQCDWAGAPPYSHILLQKLTPGQRELIIEAAELQRSTAGGRGRTTGSSRATLGGMLGRPAGSGAGAGMQPEQHAEAAAGQQEDNRQQQQQQQQDEEEELASFDAAAALAGSGWLRQAAEQALRHLLPVLGMTPRSLLQSWGAPRPGGLLVTGPAGSGKSALLAAAAAALQQHPECLTYCVTVSCRDISAEGTSQAQAQILPKIQEALEHLPSLLVFDDLDVLCPAESAGADGAASSADPALLTWLCDLLDHLATPSPDWGRLPLPAATNSSLGASTAALAAALGGTGTRSSSSSVGGNGGAALWPPLAVAATCRDVAALAAPLRAAGRLDHTVSLPAPTAESRAAMLAAAAQSRGAQLAPQHLRFVAEKADGFDATDLEVLLDRALHIAVRRQLATAGSSLHADSSGSSFGSLQMAVTRAGKPVLNGSSEESSGRFAGSGGAGNGSNGGSIMGAGIQLTQGDMEAALEGFTPAAFWGTGTRHSVQAGVAGWADVGGMEEARQALHEALELPTKYARLVAKAPLRLRTGVLLYGPPGCGKTHIVAAAVAAANVRCITVSGPELLNKYIGASEAAVRDVFARAAAAAPSVLFFDEFDAIAPQRGHDNTGVTDRVVNQLLTELDGVEGLRGVCVVAATSRPDLIDAALLRPGRLDRLVFCGFPSPLERGQVLAALARGVQLEPGVDLGLVGYNAEFYSGADLGALLAEAQLAAVHEILEEEEAVELAAAAASGAAGSRKQGHHAHAHAHHRPPVIQARHLETALQAARPSVPEAERERLEAIYAGFRQDREPGGGGEGTRDKGKGKLVSWA